MLTTLTIVHSIISILLIAVVLFQFGKGAEAGLTVDSSSMLPNHRDNVLLKITVFLTICFLGLSLYLAVLRGHEGKKSIFDSSPKKARALNDDHLTETTKSAEGKDGNSSANVDAIKNTKDSATK